MTAPFVPLALILAGERHPPVVYFARVADGIKIGWSATRQAALLLFGTVTARMTAQRLLQAAAAEGYAEPGGSTRRYRATDKARAAIN